MTHLPCLWHNKQHDLHLNSVDLTLTNVESSQISTHNYNKITNIQIKNNAADGSEKYFIKIIFTGNESIILQFINMNCRDICKSILIYKSLLYANNSTNEETDAFYKLFLSNQIFMNIFININKGVQQFQNIYKTSAFFSSKNTKNEFDVLLEKKMNKQFNTNTDGFTAVNKKTFLEKVEELTEKVENKNIENIRKVDFDMYDMFLVKDEDGKERLERSIKFSHINYEKCDLSQNLKNQDKILINNRKNTIQFVACDFETARDFCRLLYKKKNTDEYEEIKTKAMEFNKLFKEMMKGKYGEEGYKYVERIFPENFM